MRFALLTSVVALLAALGPAVTPASAAFTFVADENGANDEPGQKDLTRHGVDPSGLPTSLGVSWNWDTTGFGGSNTGDACSLFDNDDNGFVDFAVCVTIEDDPAVQATTSPRLFTCGDDRVDRCTTPHVQIPSPLSSCTVAITATQPFVAGEDTPNDTTATCTIFLSDVGGTNARLVNTCSTPSTEPNSDPSDCVLIIRDGFIRIVKDASPNDPTAQFPFFLDGGATPVFTSSGSGTSSIIPVTTSATHSVTETAPTGWTQTGASCNDGSPLNAISVSEDETVVCTFTNVRQTGKLEVKKSLVPSGDAGLFNLQIDGTTDANATNVGNNGSTGEETLPTGNHTVGETAGTSTSLDDYQKSIVCKDNNGTGATVASVGPDNAGPLTVNVTNGADIVCTITNTREAGKLEVKKSLVPSGDPGLFNLQIDGTTDPDAANVGNNGSTGEQTVNPGNHTVGETAGTSTSLGDYQKSIVCKAGNGSGSTVAQTSGDDGGPLTVPVASNDDIVCTITNTRETGKLEVKKSLSPTDDPGLFNLQIDGSTDPDATNVGNGGSTGEETVNTGTHTVGEIAGTSTSLANYQKSIECKANNGTGSVVASVGADSAGPLNVPVGFGDDIVCTITNTRETGQARGAEEPQPNRRLRALQPPDRRHDRPRRRQRRRPGLDRRGDRQHRRPHRRRDRRHRHGPLRLPEVDRLQGRQRQPARPSPRPPVTTADRSLCPSATATTSSASITNTRETGSSRSRSLSARLTTPASSTSRSTGPPIPTLGTSATAARPARRPSTPAATTSGRPPARTPTWPTTRSRSFARTTTATAQRSPKRRATTADRSACPWLTATTSSA